MAQFPDESLMPRSADNSEPIRGGSIGLNRILSWFVDHKSDLRPQFGSVLISAFTVFQNVRETYKDANMEDLEAAFVKDITLFLEYYDSYLSLTRSHLQKGSFNQVIVYFPSYARVAKEIRKEHTGKTAEVLALYDRFLGRNRGKDELVRQMENVQCFWVRVGEHTYPHRELARKFTQLSARGDSAYSPNDKVALLTSVRLDYHIVRRLRGVGLLERYTGLFKAPSTFRFSLDKEGRIPFHPVAHLLFGDNLLLKPWMDRKTKKLVLDTAEKEHWKTKPESAVLSRLIKLSGISQSDLVKYDFL